MFKERYHTFNKQQRNKKNIYFRFEMICRCQTLVEHVPESGLFIVIGKTVYISSIALKCTHF